MKNDADFGDACCQRAAAATASPPRLAPQASYSWQEKGGKNLKKLVCSLGRFVCFCFTLAAHGQEKIQFKNYCCTLLVARQQHVPLLLASRGLSPQKHVDYFKMYTSESTLK